jgi:uncharacterized protein YciI
MKYLVLTLRESGFDPAVIPAHYEFLDELRSGDLLEQAGPFTDRSGGAYVLKAGSMKEAQRLAERDPLHLRRCSKIAVHEWNAN